MKRLQCFIVVLLFALFCLSSASVLFFDEYFYRIAPRLPDVQRGAVYVHHVKAIHGVATVYLTRLEKCPYYAVFVGAAFIVLAYVLNRRWKCFQKLS